MCLCENKDAEQTSVVLHPFLRNVDEDETQSAFNFGDVPELDAEDVPLGLFCHIFDLLRKQSGDEASTTSSSEDEGEASEEETTTEDEESACLLSMCLVDILLTSTVNPQHAGGGRGEPSQCGDPCIGFKRRGSSRGCQGTGGKDYRGKE